MHEVQKEAVVAVQRACEVNALPPLGRQLLLRCSEHLRPLVDAEDAGLRGASLELLGRFCALARRVSPDDSLSLPESPDQLEAEVSGHLDLLLVLVMLQD